jgi:hypothetical protein
VVKYGSARQATDGIIWRLRLPYRITGAKDTDLEYVTLIAFPHQIRLRESALNLRHTYIVCPFKIHIVTNTITPLLEAVIYTWQVV